MDKTPVASSRPGKTNIVTKADYSCSTINPKSEFHEADLVDTLYWNRKDHSQRVRRIGYKF
jgi:hypothetical protein